MSLQSQGAMDVRREIRALWHRVLDMERRTTEQGGGVVGREHTSSHSSGGNDEIDITDLGGFPGGTTTFLRADGDFATPPGSGDVNGPSSSTDNAIPRFSGTGGKTIENTGVTIDDENFIVPNGLHIPLFDAGNSGTSIEIDWDDGNEQLVTLTGNCTLSFTNPREGGRYVLLLSTGAGSFTVAFDEDVRWPGGTPPTITTDASKYDLITLICLSTGSPIVYLGSFNQDY